MGVAEQRYQAVLAVLGDGRTVSEVAGQWKVSRQQASREARQAHTADGALR
jgi:hypothetical protein